MRGFRELMITRETYAPPQSYAYTVQETLISCDSSVIRDFFHFYFRDNGGGKLSACIREQQTTRIIPAGAILVQ